MKIIGCVVLALLLVGCSEDAKKEVKQVKEVEKVSEVKQVKEKTVLTPQAVVAQKVLAPASTTKEVEKVVASVDAKDLFKSCSACHGLNGEKPALGKSKLIQGWSAAKVTKALNEFKNGTYDSPTKKIMKSNASRLNDEQIKILSDYISKL